MRVPLPAAITTTSIAVMVFVPCCDPIIRQPRQALWRRWLARAVLILAALGLTGCSLIETTYNQSPFLLQWWLHRQFDLNSEQKQALKAELRTLQAWHRQQQLPVVNQSVLGLIGLARQNLSVEQTCGFQNDVWASLPVLAQQVTTRLAPLALTLKPEQITHLRKSFDEENQKWREEWLEGSEEERLQRRLKRALDRVEDYYGDLDASQKNTLREVLRRSPYNPQIAWQERLRRQADVVDTLERIRLERPNLAEVQKRLLELSDRALNPPVAAHRQHLEQNAAYLCAATSQVHNSMQTEQRQKAQNKLSQQQQALARLLKAG
jgi:hypothetical protein